MLQPRPLGRARLDTATRCALFLCGLAGLWEVWLVRRLWFWYDDWSFLLKRHLSHDTWWNLFHPHNEHWSTIPVVLWRAMFTLFGFDYLPYALMPISAHLVTCLVLFVVLRRTGAGPGPAVATMALLLFLGAGSTTIFWAFQIGFLGAVALGFGALAMIADSAPTGRRRALVWAMLSASLMCAGVGISMVAFAAFFSLMRHGLRSALLVASAPTAAYVVWYAAIGHVGNSGQYANPMLMVPAILIGLAVLWEHIVMVPHTGLLVFVLFCVVAWRGRRHPRLRMLAVAGLAALLVNLILITLTRAVDGFVFAAVADRYAYVGILLTLPAFAYTTQLAWERIREQMLGLRLLGLALVAVLIVPGAWMQYGYTAKQVVLEAGFKQRIAAARAMLADGEPLVSRQVDPLVAPDLTTGFLRDPAITGRLPTSRASARQRLNEAANLQVAVGDRSLHLGGPAAVRVSDVVELHSSGGCVRGAATGRTTIELSATEPAQVWLSTAAGDLGVSLIRDGLTSSTRHWQREAYEPFWVGWSAASSTVKLSLPAGRFTMCGIGAAVETSAR
ncbi:ABC transporter permease family protein [Nocardioides mangrovicus]|uniref:hypothetical protein n=1 Tax=Nocardioides mangrovicus TaxID=2478913 RepID=UPI001314369C|nr:hypothetical protein [Nocardioides mangrovicus]